MTFADICLFLQKLHHEETEYQRLIKENHTLQQAHQELLEKYHTLQILHQTKKMLPKENPTPTNLAPIFEIDEHGKIAIIEPEIFFE